LRDLGYIKTLWGIVGSMPLILPGAAVIITRDEGRQILLQRRRDSGAWGLPGGYMEPGETLEETARREAYEETGLEVGEMSLYGVFSGPQFFHVYPNGDQVHNVTAVYLTSDFSGEMRADPAEGLEVRFFDIAGLPEQISAPDRPVIEGFMSNSGD